MCEDRQGKASVYVALPAAPQSAADLSKVALTKQTFINGLATLGAKVRQIHSIELCSFVAFVCITRVLGDKPCASKLWSASSRTQEKGVAVGMRRANAHTRCHCADGPVLRSAPPAASCCRLLRADRVQDSSDLQCSHYRPWVCCQGRLILLHSWSGAPTSPAGVSSCPLQWRLQLPQIQLQHTSSIRSLPELPQHQLPRVSEVFLNPGPDPSSSRSLAYPVDWV